MKLLIPKSVQTLDSDMCKVLALVDLHAHVSALYVFFTQQNFNAVIFHQFTIVIVSYYLRCCYTYFTT